MTGRIPKQFIDEVLLRADIVEVIDSRVPLKKAGKDYKACCPFHDEKGPSFTVSPVKQFYHCFGCGAHGTAIGFLMEYEHMSFPEAVEELAGRVGLQLPKESVVANAGAKSDNTAASLKALEEATRYYRAQLREAPRAIAYLKGRGISGETAAAFGLGFAPDGWDHLIRHLGQTPEAREILIQAGLAVRKDGGGGYDRFRDRVMFPIHDYRGRIVGFGGRIIDKGEPKYLNSPETPLFHKGRELYGLFRARDAIRRVGCALVVEGYMDVVGLAQAGIDNAVATLGTATTREHMERLFRFVPEVVFCFDGDRAGREAAWRALETTMPVLHEGRQVSFLFLPDGEDPDTLVRQEGGEAFTARMGRAMPLPDFLFQSLAKQVDLTRLDGRARLVELARPLLSNLPAGVFRQMMIDRLGEYSRVPVAELAVVFGGARNPVAPTFSARQRAPAYGAQPKQPASVVRVAAALLVQHPELGAQIQDSTAFQELDLPGMPVFRALVGVVCDRPSINTAALVEHFRDSEHQQSVARLAMWTHPALSQDVAAEFRGVLAQLRKAATKAKVDHLLQKQPIYGLTSAEEVELARLLAEKPEPVSDT
ncbi:MAG: DNA primase [Gammaproteobacteria bacterium]|nr:DNA primase [Gammaproteobacteria bacterium]